MLRRVRERGIPWPAPSFFRSRLLMCGALCFAIGVALARVLPYLACLWVVPPLCVGAAVLLRRHGRAVFAFAMLGLLVLGSLRSGMELVAPELPPTGRWTVQGTVQGEVRQNERAVMFWLSNVQVQTQDGETWQRIDGNLYCYYPTESKTKLAHGQHVSVSGSTYLPTSARNPGGFDQRMWMAQNGAHVRMYASSAPKIVEPAGFSLRGLALSINASLGARMDALFGQASPVIRAMLLGDQTDMPDEWSGWMRDSGIAHLLAVSGLHVALWYALLERLLRPLTVSPRVRWVFLAALLSAYALVTGLKPSVLRAVIMLLAVQGAHVAQRKADTLTSLSLAALLILLFRPLDLFGAGFQLSFTAVLGIVLLRPALKKAVPIQWDWLGEPLYTTIAAQLGILPAASYWFGTASLLGSLVNLVAIPLTGLLIPVAALATALDALWQPLGWLFVQASYGMTGVLVWMARLAASVPYAYTRVGAFAWWTAAAYFGAMLLCSTAVIWRWRTRAAAIALSAVLALGIAYVSGAYTTRYVQLDVGQALSGVLHTGGKTYVYDCGDINGDLTEYLYFTGGDIDGLFLSHPHTDHTGGLTEALDAGIRVKTVYVPVDADAFGAEPDYEGKLSRLTSQGAEIVEVGVGDVLELGGVRATIVAPDREILQGSDPNDRSLVVLWEIGDYLLLLMGDADGGAEPLGVDTDVLQVAHHGSRNAAQPAFLADATPDIALISTGRNTYGHPNADTVARLEDAGAEIYITQDSGAVTLYFAPGGIRVEEYCR